MTPAEPPPPGARSDDLYEDAACGLLVTGADGMILTVNSTFCRWLGRTADELVGAVRIQDLLTMGGRMFHQTHWAPLLQIQGSVAEVKLEIVAGDRRTLPMVMNAVRRETGGVVRHELAVFPAADRHQYERELLLARRRAEELLVKEQVALQALAEALAERDRQQARAEDRASFAEQMMAVVSHDLRNPLSVVRVCVQLVNALGPLLPKQKTAIDRIERSARRAGRLITDLLDFSQVRIGTGLNMERLPLALHALVGDALDELRVAYPGRELLHHAEGAGACDGNADRLVQLIGNLVSNAMHYGDGVRPVSVSTAIGVDRFSIAVHNDGPPIAPEALPTLFEAMTRATDANNPGNSIGLGLYIVREIARAHGGDVAVVSTADAGTTFSATFPRSRDDAPQAMPAPPVTP